MKAGRNHRTASARSTGSDSAYTIIEVLLTSLCVGVLVATAVLIVSGMSRATKDQKLTHDVRTLNAAVAFFIANGGDLEGADTPGEVIARLGTSASAHQADQLVGVRSSVLDHRVTPLMQTPAEGATTEARVLWDVTKKRFVIRYGGHTGVKKFVFDESKPPIQAERDRDLVIAYSKKGKAKWIWDFNDSPTTAKSIRGIDTQDNPPPPIRSALDLKPPIVSVPPGNYPLTDYEGFKLSLRDPNPQGTGEMMYSINGQPWVSYRRPFPIDPGDELRTQTVSLDPKNWRNSPIEEGDYATTPVQLVTSLSFPSQRYTYVTLGGTLEPGSYAAPPQALPGRLELGNPASIPLQYQNSDVFGFNWIQQNSAGPSSRPTLNTSDPFKDGFPGQDILLSLDDWGSSDTLEVSAIARSHNPNIVSDSERTKTVLTATRIQLRPPLVEIAGADDKDKDKKKKKGKGKSKDELVTISLQKDFGDVPFGARIFYTTDGTDPGVRPDGEPESTQEYTGPFELEKDMDEIIARVYAPSLYQHWFIPSEPSSSPSTVTPPSVGLVGGHIDVDTSNSIAKIGSGDTDGHVHEYDKEHGVTHVDFFDLLTDKLQDIDQVVSNGKKFKLIVANADLSPGAKIVINSDYVRGDASTYVQASEYDDTAPADLPVYSFNGAAGTVPLSKFSVNFDSDAIELGGIIPTNTGDVKKNTPGLRGEWRNGALTIQAVEVNGSGKDQFTTNTSLSAGGKQGVATSGLLWEATIFWHWKGDSYHKNPDYQPGSAVPRSWLELTP